MNVAARDLRPKKPARYDQHEFGRLIRLLPDAALRRLEAVVEELQHAGRDVNLVAVAKALLAHSLLQAATSMPPVPVSLLPYTDPEISAGREYGLMLHVDPHDTPAMVRAREQFIDEARRVRDLMQDGWSANDAWQHVARRSALDDLPNGHRERITRRPRSRQ